MRKLVFLVVIALAFAACSSPTGDDGVGNGNQSIPSYPSTPSIPEKPNTPDLPETPVDPSLPALTGTVIIIGYTEVGYTLTANTAYLNGSGTISYQWKRGTDDIGTDSMTYTVVSADMGSNITVTVTRSGYTGNVTSQAIAIPIRTIYAYLYSVTANGSNTQTTTALTLTFDRAITELTADDITLSGVFGVQKGTISGSGSVYTLPISGFSANGTLNVTVTKSGYVISSSSKTVNIYYYTPPTVEIVIDLEGMNEWELLEQTAQATPGVNKSFIVNVAYYIVNGSYLTYQWYLDGVSVVGSSYRYTFNKPAGVYQLTVVVTTNSGEKRSGRCRITVSN